MDVAATPPRRRADAERNIDGILTAARDLFGKGRNPSMIEVAQAAGVGRVTLYNHFPSREVLLEAVIQGAIEDTDRALSNLRLDHGPPAECLARLVGTSWSILDQYRRLHAVALEVLGPEHLRRRHDRAFRHVQRLIARGRSEGVFRTDLPEDWLVTTCYALIHAAADEVGNGELTTEQAPGVLTATLLSVLETRASQQHRRRCAEAHDPSDEAAGRPDHQA